MEPQNEMHQKSGAEADQRQAQQVESGDHKSADMASGEQRIEPFSNDDPFLATRITETRSETDRLLQSISSEPVGFERLNRKQIKSLYANAVERSQWSQARQDAFASVLRLGVRVPPRANRVL